MNLDTRRMLWRCRRGLLELDIVLEHFVSTHFETLTQPQLETFDALLGYTDNELWDLLVHRDETDDVRIQELLGMMACACAREEKREDKKEAAGHEH